MIRYSRESTAESLEKCKDHKRDEVNLPMKMLIYLWVAQYRHKFEWEQKSLKVLFQILTLSIDGNHFYLLH